MGPGIYSNRLRPIPESDYECFDYIMNTRSLYVKLGQALGFFERSMKRDRATMKHEFSLKHGRGGPHPWSLVGLKRWYLLTSDLIGDARRDFQKNFPEETQEWLVNASVENLLRLARMYRSRWATSTLTSPAVHAASR